MAFDFGTANGNQKQAILATEGPVLIIAGPGTGKTFTLVKRAVYLITEKEVKPENIMIATFTEKAAKEIITRISNELLRLNINVNINELYIGTIHSICLRLIKENLEFTRLKKNYRLLDDFEQKYLIYQNISEFDSIANIELIYGNRRKAWEKAKVLCYYINAISEELVTAEELSANKNLEVKTLSLVIEKYNQLLSIENALDFSSIQSIAYNLLLDNPDICNKIQSEIKYIMIDEYQDTNYVQEQLVFLIGKNHRNICVVGDDDQGLYRFRGATIRNILEFPLKFPDCQKVTLSENYRSEKSIVEFYNDWMSITSGRDFSFEWGTFRFDKKIIPAKDKFIEGTPTVLKAGGDSDNWSEQVLNFIKKLKSSGKLEDYNQIAFLFSSVKHNGATSLSEYLEKNGVPVYSPRSNLFFERDEICFLIGALILCFPDYANRLNKGQMWVSPEIRDYYIECVKKFAEYLNQSANVELKKFIQKKAFAHVSPTSNFDYAFTGLIYSFFQYDPFKSWLDVEISGVNDTRAVRNLSKFTELTTRFEYLHRMAIFTAKQLNKTVEYFFNVFMRFLMDGGISEYEDEEEYAPKGCVSFMTIHQSKGLEFPVVFVGSLYTTPRNQETAILEMLENEVYHRKPFEPFNRMKYYDFWRLYYTAFSRAQNLLVLLAKEHTGRGPEPSKYFEEVYWKLPYYFDKSVDYSKYSFEKVKDINIKQSYSFTSHISVYENCALQYKYYKELGFSPVRTGATFFGTLVHQTIEDIHRAALRGEESAITAENIKNWFDSNYTNLSMKEHSYLAPATQKAALNQVMRYADKQTGDWSKIIDAEVEVSQVEPNYILSGKIDLVRGEGDTVEIIDFKSEKKPDMQTDRDSIERYHRQLQIYAYIIEQRYNYKVSKMSIYYTGETDGVPYINFDNRASDMVKTMRQVDDTIRKIQCKDFLHRADKESLCKNCDLRYFCGR